MNRSRLPIILTLIISIAVAGISRHFATAERYSGRGALTRPVGGAGFARMNSYALALLLGGLRGPLVMILWPSSEAQKNEKQLEDFDTKIEWIRMLQSEFDTVHIFQMWNKAYNISVQKANIGNKYRTILDAIDYGQLVDAERPNNINIIFGIGQIYFDKLGSSTEKNYYRARVREETQAREDQVRITLPAARRSELSNHAMDLGVSGARMRFGPERQDGTISITLPKDVATKIQEKFTGEQIKYEPRPYVARSRDDAGRRTELDPVLDKNGNILPQYLVANNPRPADLPADSEWNDGSELQYLKQFEPFKYGVSTLALGLNYYKQAQVLQSVNKQKHAQNSELVVDSRPAQALRNWSEEEWEIARKAELEAFGKRIPDERFELESPTAYISLDTSILHRARLDEAIYSYDRSAMLVDRAIGEYNRHLENHQTNISQYLSHIQDLEAGKEMVQADRDFILAMLNSPDRQERIKSATEHYQETIRRYQTIVLQYYVTDEVAQRLFPPGVTRANIGQKDLSRQDTERLFLVARQSLPPFNDLEDALKEYFQYIARAQIRLASLNP